MNKDEPKRFSTVDGDRPAGKVRPGRRRSLNESEQVTCGTCEGRTGTATSAVVLLTIAPRRRPDGSMFGGTKIWTCAHCLSAGIVTELGKA